MKHNQTYLRTLLDLSVVRKQIKDEAGDQLGDSNIQLHHCTSREAFDAYLRWNGIIGFTDEIIEALDAFRAAETAQTRKENEKRTLT